VAVAVGGIRTKRRTRRFERKRLAEFILTGIPAGAPIVGFSPGSRPEIPPRASVPQSVFGRRQSSSGVPMKPSIVRSGLLASVLATPPLLAALDRARRSSRRAGPRRTPGTYLWAAAPGCAAHLRIGHPASQTTSLLGATGMVEACAHGILGYGCAEARASAGWAC
jgi:hypothetical protein